MADTLTPPTPQSVLIDQVAVPAFFEKLAAVSGISPPDQQTAKRLIDLGDVVTPAIGLFLEKQARAVQEDEAAGVKVAADATFELMFGRQPPQTDPAAFLKVAGVRDAALLLADQAAKTAMAECAPGMPAMPAGKKDDDDEEDPKAPKLPAPPAA